jgi:hypothetical protein
MTQAQTAQKTTFGGYVIGKASATDQVGKTESSFDLRFARVYANGQIQNVGKKEDVLPKLLAADSCKVLTDKI